MSIIVCALIVLIEFRDFVQKHQFVLSPIHHVRIPVLFLSVLCTSQRLLVVVIFGILALYFKQMQIDKAFEWFQYILIVTFFRRHLVVVISIELVLQHPFFVSVLVREESSVIPVIDVS